MFIFIPNDFLAQTVCLKLIFKEDQFRVEQQFFHCLATVQYFGEDNGHDLSSCQDWEMFIKWAGLMRALASQRVRARDFYAVSMRRDARALAEIEG